MWQWLAFSPQRNRLLVLSCDELATNQGCTPPLARRSAGKGPITVGDGGLQKGPQQLNLCLFYHQEPRANERKEKLDRVLT